MRLPWPFRHHDPPSPTAPDARPQRAAAVQRAPLDEWRDMDPPSGLGGPPALTADGRFGDSLTGQQQLPPVLEPVARGGDLAPLTDSSPSAKPATRSTIRGASRESTRTYRRPQRAPVDDMELMNTAADESILQDSSDTAPRSALPSAPIPRRVAAATPSVAGAASQSPRRAPLPADLTVVPAAQRSAIDDVGVHGHISMDAPDAATRQTPGTESISAIAKAMPLEPEKASSGQLLSHAPGAPLAAARRRPTLGQSRRAGLGAPLPLPPQRQADSVSVHESTSGPQPGAVSPEPLPQTDGAASRSPSIQMSSAPSGPTDSDLTANESEPRAASSGPTQSSLAQAAAPLHLRRSRTPRRQAQRAPASSAEPSVAGMPPTSTIGPVHIDRSESGAASAADLGANAFTAGDTIVMPPSHGPLDRGRGQALLAHELTHVNQQRSLGSSLPPEDSSAGQALEREAQSAESAVSRAAPSATSTPAMPLARRQSAPADVGPRPGTQSQAVSEATSVALAAAAAGTPGGESGSIEVPAPGTAMHTTHAAQRSRASSGAAASSTSESDTGADDEFDELARRIYDRVRLRLRRELLLERERGGYLTDSR